jgi:uncharacterized protein (TIGR00661 family)
MAKILYGIAGEGSGHSSRAREILTHLIAQGHDVRAISYDRGYKNLRDDFDVHEIVGLTIVSEDNKVSPIRTVLENLRGLKDGIRSFRTTRRKFFKQFKPDCVITDFEPTSAYLANYYDIPLISIDNQHRMRYMEYERPSGYSKDAKVTETVIRAMVPRPDVSLVTTFHYDKPTNDHTFLFPPILRKSVLDLTPQEGEHILVYATSGFDSLINLLPQFPRERFLVYGYNRDAVEGNIIYRPFSQTGFLTDLANARAVIATAGFTLITEALYLGKPYLALPMQGQFEQVLNAFMLNKLQYGAAAYEITAQDIAAFLYHLDDYHAALKTYPREDNHRIQAFLDSLFESDCARIRQFHR